MQRKWTARELLVWGLSIVLAIQFLAAGIPKVLGSENAWVQAFAMWGYPEWFRVVVGIAEIACGILLLVPAAAPFAAIVLAIIMTGALFTRLASATALEDPRVWTPAILLVLVPVLALAVHNAGILGKLGAEALAVQADVSDEAAVARLVQAAARTRGSS